MEPNRVTVIRRMREYDRVDRAKFLDLYADGRGAKRHVIAFKGRRYDLKAIWAAAHVPPVAPRSFNTREARVGLESLRFKCLALDKAESSLFEEGERYLGEVELIARHPGLVAKAKAHHGLCCSACGFDFESFYGLLGAGYIECHHLGPLATRKNRVITSIEDVAVLCSNCHRMVLRQNPPISIGDLQQIIKTARQN